MNFIEGPLPGKMGNGHFKPKASPLLARAVAGLLEVNSAEVKLGIRPFYIET